MIELTKDQKIQMVSSRRQSVSRNIFELQLDIVVMNSQGRTDDVTVLNQRIAELENTDLALQQFIETL